MVIAIKFKISYQNGNYILSPSGSAFPSGLISAYDEFLPSFDMIYHAIPRSVMASQIEETNDSLYSFMSQDEIKALEEGILHYNVPEDLVNAIISRSEGSPTL